MVVGSHGSRITVTTVGSVLVSDSKRRRSAHQRCQKNGNVVALYGDPYKGYEVVMHTDDVVYVPNAALALNIYKSAKAALLATTKET